MLLLIISKKNSFIILCFLLFFEENKDIKQKEIIFQFIDFIKVFRHLSISLFEDKVFKKIDIDSLMKE